MASALDLITRALKERKVLGTSETLTNDEAQDGLTSLNAMLKTWSLKRLMVYQILQENFALTAGDGEYTIGAGGNFNTTRPGKLSTGSFVREGSVDYELTMIDFAEYSKIPIKGTGGTPQVISYDAQYPLARILLYPLPGSGQTLYLNSLKALQQFTALTTDLAMPPEYEEAIVFNLAMRLASYGGEMTPEARAVASESLSALKTTNQPTRYMSTDIGYMGRPNYDIAAG
jgi:hypothetical protein